MILRTGERDAAGAVDQSEQAGLLALEKLLDHHRPIAGGSDCGFGVGAAHGDGDALARGEAIGLDHYGDGESVERGEGGALGVNADVGSGRDIVLGAQILGETLRPFEHRRGGGRAEGRDPGAAQRIGNPGDKRCLGADNDQVDRLRLGQGDDGGWIAGVDRAALGPALDPGIAGRGDQQCAAWRLRKPPRQRIFTAPRPEQQDIHERFR